MYITVDRSFLAASLSGDRERAARSVSAPGFDVELNGAWFHEHPFIRMRLMQLQEDSAYEPWAPQIIVLERTREMIGHVGFHTAPDPDYLRPTVPNAVEIGYTTYEEYRGNGYATEALGHVMSWANEAYGVSRFVLSISPENKASLRIAAKFAFVLVGRHIDPEDGPEDIYLKELAPRPHRH